MFFRCAALLNVENGARSTGHRRNLKDDPPRVECRDAKQRAGRSSRRVRARKDECMPVEHDCPAIENKHAKRFAQAPESKLRGADEES